MNCQLQVLTSEESFQFIFITVLQGVNPRDSNKLLRVLEDLPLRFSLVHQLGWLPDGFENIYFSKLEIHTPPQRKVCSRSDAKILLNDMWLGPQLVRIALPDRTPFFNHVMAICKAKQGFHILIDDYLR